MLPKLLVHEIAFSVVASHEVYLHNSSQEKLQPASASTAAYFGLNPFIAVRSRRLRGCSTRMCLNYCNRLPEVRVARTGGDMGAAFYSVGGDGYGIPAKVRRAESAPRPQVFAPLPTEIDRAASRNTSAVAKRLGRLAIDLRNELVCVTTCSTQPDNLWAPLVLSKMPMAFL